MKKISRSQWVQIAKRVRLANYSFDKSWKCLICGFSFLKCEHTHDENVQIIEGVKTRFEI